MFKLAYFLSGTHCIAVISWQTFNKSSIALRQQHTEQFTAKLPSVLLSKRYAKFLLFKVWSFHVHFFLILWLIKAKKTKLPLLTAFIFWKCVRREKSSFVKHGTNPHVHRWNHQHFRNYRPNSEPKRFDSNAITNVRSKGYVEVIYLKRRDLPGTLCFTPARRLSLKQASQNSQC